MRAACLCDTRRLGQIVTSHPRPGTHLACRVFLCAGES
nr:MAG TPA: hypothetical protein [Bacteriophage sp.]